MLAATFAALTVMPLLCLAQIGRIVAVGVPIDTLLVRPFLAPLSFSADSTLPEPGPIRRALAAECRV
ncbi:MMPL family transporter [Streptomyces sp. BK79]|uniref:MMPL family transporter n=1 Tax=Streptomyces sp. BK79 TaxID=3350097 RepID=UPI00376FFF96